MLCEAGAGGGAPKRDAFCLWCSVGLHGKVLTASTACSGFTACEAGAGGGVLTRDAFELLDGDNHCELLQYTATDASADGAQRLRDAIAKPSFQTKVRAPLACALAVSILGMLGACVFRQHHDDRDRVYLLSPVWLEKK